MREGGIFRLTPIAEAGRGVAYRVIDDSDGKEIMVVLASSVKVERS
jgi:hypothetical protein